MGQDQEIPASDGRLSHVDKQSILTEPSHGGEVVAPPSSRPGLNVTADEATHDLSIGEASRSFIPADSKDTKLEDQERIPEPSTFAELSGNALPQTVITSHSSHQHVGAKVEDSDSSRAIDPPNVVSIHSGDTAAAITGTSNVQSSYLELTPAAASLLPISAAPRASTPMMESEPILKSNTIMESEKAVGNVPALTPSALVNEGKSQSTFSKPTPTRESEPVTKSNVVIEPESSGAGVTASTTSIPANEGTTEKALPTSAPSLEAEPKTISDASAESNIAAKVIPAFETTSEKIYLTTPIPMPKAESLAEPDVKLKTETARAALPHAAAPLPTTESKTDQASLTHEIETMQIADNPSDPAGSQPPISSSMPQDAPSASNAAPTHAPASTSTSVPEHGTSHLMATAYQPVPAEVRAAAPALRRRQQPADPTTNAPQPVNDPTAATNALDDSFYDTDSALGSMSYQSSSTSVDSSAYETVTHRGRTYHSYKAGKYLLPNDPAEQDRLDFQHQMFLLQNDGRLYQAPLEPHKISRVLDIATGTGIWAIDFADDFPNAEVIGSDLSPIQPRWCPPNCHFEIDDAEDDWVWSEPFSYIHGRALLTCFADPKAVIQKAYNALEPGGWLEFQDATFPFEYEDPTMDRVVPGRMDQPYKHPLQRWTQIAYEGCIRGGRRWDNSWHYKQWFEEVGLLDVVEVWDKAALGVHQGLTEKEFKVATLHGSNIHQGLQGLSNRVFDMMGFGVQETAEMVKAAQKTFTNNTCGAYTRIITVYGRKPA